MRPLIGGLAAWHVAPRGVLSDGKKLLVVTYWHILGKGYPIDLEHIHCTYHRLTDIQCCIRSVQVFYVVCTWRVRNVFWLGDILVVGFLRLLLFRKWQEDRINHCTISWFKCYWNFKAESNLTLISSWGSWLGKGSDNCDLHFKKIASNVGCWIYDRWVLSLNLAPHFGKKFNLE